MYCCPRYPSLASVTLLTCARTQAHIVKYHQFFLNGGPDGRVPELVMDLIPGYNLQQEHDRSPLDEWEAQESTRQLMGALSYIHGKQLIHCDIKPANLMVKARQPIFIVLVDFGSVADVGSTKCRGTPRYAAPEIYANRPIDTSFDIWSVGIIFLELSLCLPPTYQEPKDVHIRRLHHHLALLDEVPKVQFSARLLKTSPEGRPTATACLEDPYMAPRQAEECDLVDTQSFHCEDRLPDGVVTPRRYNHALDIEEPVHHHYTGVFEDIEEPVQDGVGTPRGYTHGYQDDLAVEFPENSGVEIGDERIVADGPNSNLSKNRAGERSGEEDIQDGAERVSHMAQTGGLANASASIPPSVSVRIDPDSARRNRWCGRFNPDTGRPCNKPFSRPSHLRRHVATVHEPGPRQRCTVCGKTFKNTDNLREHSRRTQHGGAPGILGRSRNT